MATKELLELRQTLIQERLGMAQAHILQTEFEQQILRFLNELELKKPKFIHTIALYWPIQGEPDIRAPLLKWLKRDPSRKLALPITQKGQALNFAQWDDQTKTQAGLFGIEVPLQQPFIDPDLIIAPCLGWQELHQKIWRIGYGGGYYDRTMAKLHQSNPSTLIIGVALDNHRVEKNVWRPQIHDVPLNALITESRIISHI